MTAVLFVLAVFSGLCTVLGVMSASAQLAMITEISKDILDRGAYSAAVAQAEAKRQAVLAQNGPKG